MFSMRGAPAIPIVLVLTLITCGCMGGYYGAGYSIYTYSGIHRSATYDDIYFEESELISLIEAYNMTKEGRYSHYTNSFGMGHFSFYFVNATTNITNENAMMSFRINECELAPGSSDMDSNYGENVFATNVTFTFSTFTEHDTSGMDSDDRGEADRLSDGIYQLDLATYGEYLERFYYILEDMLGNEPIYEFEGREYDIMCVD